MTTIIWLSYKEGRGTYQMVFRTVALRFLKATSASTSRRLYLRGNLALARHRNSFLIPAKQSPRLCGNICRAREVTVLHAGRKRTGSFPRSSLECSEHRFRKGGSSYWKDLSLPKQKVWVKHSGLLGNDCRGLSEAESNKNSHGRPLLPGLRYRGGFREWLVAGKS